MRILADTNILLRRIHRKHPQHRQTKEAITRLAERGDVLCVTTQNLIEFWAVCTRPIANNGLGLLPAQAIRVLSRIESLTLRLSDDTDTVYAQWKTLVADHGVSGKKTHDARLIAAMNVHGVTHILTFNIKDFERYPGIIAIDPGTF